jgi:hypothetical protein
MKRPTRRLDELAAIGGCLLMVGIFMDGWAHSHDRTDASFFTPWHGVMYLAFVLLAIIVIGGKSDSPTAYRPARVGVVLFGLGGALDLVWHEVFGVEASVEASLSPPHLILASGCFLMVTGPIAAAWLRSDVRLRWREGWPAMASLYAMLAIPAFMTQWGHPLINEWAATPSIDPVTLAADIAAAPQDVRNLIGEALAITRPGLGIASVVLQTAILASGIALAVARWRIPRAGITAVLTLYMASIAVLHDTYRLIPLAVAAGAAGDLVLAASSMRGGPSTLSGGAGALRVMATAAAVSVTLFGGHLWLLARADRMGWSPTLASGAVGASLITALVAASVVLVGRLGPADT